MGRKSLLTPAQWAEVERRHLIDHESINALAAEFGVNESSLRRRIKPNKTEMVKLAQAKVEADKQVARVSDQIAELPPAQQGVVLDLARALRATSENLASAAEVGSRTAHKLTLAAAAQADRALSAKGLRANNGALKTVAALTKGANDAAAIALNLLAANKGSQLPSPPPEAPDDLPADATDAMKAYQEFVSGPGA